MGFKVPRPYAFIKRHSNEADILPFESFEHGEELYNTKEAEAWSKTVECLARIHLKYWTNMSGIEKAKPSIDFDDKVNPARMRTTHNPLWLCSMKIILTRLNECPKTLIHGDLFPTNILIREDNATFIDWANAGEFPYFMDIAKLTGLLDADNATPFCPEKEEMEKRYYEAVKEKLQIDYTDYQRDICMGQFIELAATYFPPIGLNAHSPMAKSDYNKAVESKLNKLSELILK